LGNGTDTNSATPVVVNGSSAGVAAIASGGDHACAIVNGDVWCWGSNAFGQLGDGTINDSSMPVAVMGLSTSVVALGAGFYHTCALLTGGAVKCWGDDGSGQLADGRFVTAETPQVVIVGDEIFHDGFDAN
jgi:alpha-tubulin suppressor-like RCC1 family protein